MTTGWRGGQAQGSVIWVASRCCAGWAPRAGSSLTGDVGTRPGSATQQPGDAGQARHSLQVCFPTENQGEHQHLPQRGAPAEGGGSVHVPRQHWNHDGNRARLPEAEPGSALTETPREARVSPDGPESRGRGWRRPLCPRSPPLGAEPANSTQRTHAAARAPVCALETGGHSLPVLVSLGSAQQPEIRRSRGRV